MGSRNSTRTEFNRIIGMMEDGQIDTTPWITHRCAFDDMPSEFPRWLDPKSGVIKGIIEL